MAEVISKSALVDKVAEASKVSKKDTKAIIDALLNTIAEEVKNDAEIRLIGFGTFKKAKRAAAKAATLKLAQRLKLLQARAFPSNPA